MPILDIRGVCDSQLCDRLEKALQAATAELIGCEERHVYVNFLADVRDSPQPRKQSEVPVLVTVSGLHNHDGDRDSRTQAKLASRLADAMHEVCPELTVGAAIGSYILKDAIAVRKPA